MNDTKEEKTRGKKFSRRTEWDYNYEAKLFKPFSFTVFSCSNGNNKTAALTRQLQLHASQYARRGSSSSAITIKTVLMAIAQIIIIITLEPLHSCYHGKVKLHSKGPAESCHDTVTTMIWCHDHDGFFINIKNRWHYLESLCYEPQQQEVSASIIDMLTY